MSKQDDTNKQDNTNKSKRNSFKSLWKAIRLLAKDMPVIFPVAVLQAVLSAVQPYIGIILSAEILNELTDANRNMDHLFRLAVLLVGLNFLSRLLVNLGWQSFDLLKYIEMKRHDCRVALKAWGMDYEMLSNSKINERRRRMGHWGYSHGIVAMIQQFYEFLQSMITIGISVWLVVEFFAARAVGEGRLVQFLNHFSAPIIFLFLFGLSTAVSVKTSAMSQKRFYQFDEDSSEPFNQYFSLMDFCCAQYKSGKDIRIFHGADTIHRKMRELINIIVGQERKVTKFNRNISTLTTSLSWLFNIFVYLFVGLKAICGAFGVGSILRYTGMVNQLGGGITNLCNVIRSFIQNRSYLDDYFDFIELSNHTAKGTLSVTDEVKKNYEFEFRNVTFTYPEAETPSLKDVNCTFRKGERIAVVGRNGSGKTTFIKLLCRLYDPQEGQILLNGVDIREYNYDEYLSFFSTVFQDYSLFAFKLGENVASESEYVSEKVVDALNNAGLAERLATLNKGIETPLYKYFSEDGVELSGGESQKVAIARCLYKDAPYVIMDEPTAALDPLAEADIYQRMNQFVGDKGAIYISHRLSSCHFCDRIFVFESGAIEEHGTHNELLEAKGLYEKLWTAQAKYYAQ